MTPRRIFLRCCLAVFAVLLWQVPTMAAHAAGAAVTVNPQPPTCARTGTVNGSGYTAGQNILVYIDQTQVPTTPNPATVRSDGTWSAQFTVPTNMAPGTYPLYGIGSPDRASTPFCVGAPTSGTPPAAPSGVKNVNYGALNFRITWTDNSNNETGFEIYNGNETRTVGAGVTQY